MHLAARGVRIEVPASPYEGADQTYDQIKQYLDSEEARQVSESELERQLESKGRELLRKLLDAHLRTRSPGEAGGPVRDAEGVERTEQRDHDRGLMSIFGSVRVERVGYASEGEESLHPLDAALNLPAELYSLEVRRRVAEAVASRSFDEALLDLSRHTGAEIPKRQGEELVLRAALDFDAFYEARHEQSEPVPATGSVVVLTVDGKGVAMRREDLRELTRKAAERRRQSRLKLFNRLTSGQKRHSKRMATVAAVYTVDPYIRSPEEFLHCLMPPTPGAKAPRQRPRPENKRVWASIEKESWEVILEALKDANHRDPEHHKTWVVLVDGAENQLDLIEEMVEAYEVEVTVVLDIIHVTEYIWKAAHAFHTAGSPELEYWAWTRVRRVLAGKASTVAGAMRRAATIEGMPAAKRKAVDTCANYLIKYSAYMRYDAYLAAGLPIASGVVEGACRYLVRDRMELTGARWRLAGAEAVLRLRALRASGDFDEYWQFHESQEFKRNHEQRYADGKVPPVLEPPPPEPRPRPRRVK